MAGILSGKIVRYYRNSPVHYCRCFISFVTAKKHSHETTPNPPLHLPQRHPAHYRQKRAVQPQSHAPHQNLPGQAAPSSRHLARTRRLPQPPARPDPRTHPGLSYSFNLQKPLASRRDLLRFVIPSQTEPLPTKLEVLLPSFFPFVIPSSTRSLPPPTAPAPNCYIATQSLNHSATSDPTSPCPLRLLRVSVVKKKPLLNLATPLCSL